MPEPRNYLVAGAGGVIGTTLLKHLTAQGHAAWGVSRRPPAATPRWKHLSVNLAEANGALEGLRPAAATNRLAFAAYVERQDPQRQIKDNVALLSNTLTALERLDAPLEHVTLYQGMKYYGAHLGPFKTPALETDPRLAAANFYYEQEDLLREHADHRGYQFTLLRPEGVIGYAVGTPMNLLMGLGVYVALTRHLGVPLRFPGPREAYDSVLYQVSDAQLLAEATEWAGDAPSAWGEAFNLTNGDVFRWRQLFDAIARRFELELAEPQCMNLATQMPQHAGLWAHLAESFELHTPDLASVVDWRFTDAILGSTWDNVSSTIKVRQAGFSASLHSVERIVDLLEDLVLRKILPPLA
ncbi:MAG: SDR family oxidoreductase [Arthrobacter sp.]|jgi:nucleoside-diphosphate-sugar epimerase|nr:SDR family oxidoreductase [Arthrobacter sp.]